MYRNCTVRLVQGLPYTKDMFRKMWNNKFTASATETKVKEHVPEALEESLADQPAVENDFTSRDIIVDLGHRVIKCIENKAPTPTIAPYIDGIFKEYGASSEMINQRCLSYLLYPYSAPRSSQVLHHDLVMSFPDNIRALVAHVEVYGTSHAKEVAKEKLLANSIDREKESGTPTLIASDASEGPSVIKKNTAEGSSVSDVTKPVDTSDSDTAIVKLAAAMALANLHGDHYNNALKCVELGLIHSTNMTRRGGLLAMKAGILNRMKRYVEASQVAQQAIDTSDNVQGYIQGAASLKQLGRGTEMLALLKRGCEAHPQQEVLQSQLEAAEKTVKLSIDE